MIDERREVRDAEDSHEDYKNIYSLITDPTIQSLPKVVPTHVRWKVVPFLFNAHAYLRNAQKPFQKLYIEITTLA